MICSHGVYSKLKARSGQALINPLNSWFFANSAPRCASAVRSRLAKLKSRS
jgi:hypothetical protein